MTQPSIEAPPGNRVSTDDSELPIGDVRHWGRITTTAACVVLILFAGYSLSRNERFEWHIFGHYLFDDSILRGLRLTLALTGTILGLSIVLSTIIALARLSSVRIVSGLATAYVWFFRSIPGLVQVLIWFNLGALYPRLSIGTPWGTTFASVSATTAITPWVAAIVGFTLTEAAFMSEIIRAGIISVDRGQIQASEALGMSPLLTFRRIVAPQAIRFVIPPTVGQAIVLVKSTALVSFIGLSDLLYTTQRIYAINQQTIPLLLVATFWYIVVSLGLSVIQFYLERHFGRAYSRRSRRTWRSRGPGRDTARVDFDVWTATPK